MASVTGTSSKRETPQVQTINVDKLNVWIENMDIEIDDKIKQRILGWTDWDDNGIAKLRGELEKREFSPHILGALMPTLRCWTKTPGNKRRKTDNVQACDSPDRAKKDAKASNAVTRRDLLEDYRKGSSGTSPVDLLQTEIITIVNQTKSTFDDTPAPFIYLLQSTGYGKTRAVIELAKKRSVVYLIWKSLDGSWQIPPILNNVREEVERASDRPKKEKIWIKFIETIKQVIQNDYTNARELCYSQITREGALGNFYEKVMTKYNTIASPSIDTPTKPCIKSLGGSHKAGNPKRNEASATPTSLSAKKRPGSAGSSNSSGSDKSIVSFKDHAQYNPKTPITENSLVVCMDEVSALSDEAYRAYRRAAKQTSVLSIFVDTSASIFQLAPMNDHSSSEGNLGRLSRPLFSLRNFDVHWKKGNREEEGSTAYYRNLFRMGRPRWNSYLNSGKSVQDLIDLATNLLTVNRGVEDSTELKECSRVKVRTSALKESGNKEQLKLIKEYVSPNMIAIFAIRFSLGSASKVAPLLAKHSLATVMYVSDDRSKVHVAYPSEPILAEVSAKYTSKMNQRKKVLAHVYAAFNNATTLLDPPLGQTGEMCAAALLGYAMDEIRIQKGKIYMSSPVLLSDLLVSLDCYEASDSTFHETKNWEVNCTHFMRPDWDISKEDLKMMWERHMAFYVADGCPGLDMLLSIRHIKDKRFASFRVQVKNYSSKIYKGHRQDIMDKLLPGKCMPYAKIPEKNANEMPENILWLDSVNLLLSVGMVEKDARFRAFDAQKTDKTTAKKRKKAKAKEKTEAKKGDSRALKDTGGRFVLEVATHFPCNDVEADNKDLHETSKLLSEICAKDKEAITFLDEHFALDEMRNEHETLASGRQGTY
mmetsp:Transcript_27839/g.41082  ORF Transcript_27839/g.41082 Transcript_27839/m.41082 type:complete len:877 (+) Transcript_27839:112-2742(+)|eukprot:CAMPEP_0194228468 /NCGR_PEP_ID=MMETSP0156-20130528/43386_1 /TAXON_ID=33649 /ORGANISM="Thalassionema nitzschioides, Strain L26-B" /LENGTH=876 /DNA_ID=CAMNT_0038960983 /DNA_START=41 /DNA_END=2671 /DNA_ORIENTATION=-